MYIIIIQYFLHTCIYMFFHVECVCICSTGHQTKALLNNSGPKTKRSKLEKDINTEVLFQLILLLTICLIGAIGTLCTYIHQTCLYIVYTYKYIVIWSYLYRKLYGHIPHSESYMVIFHIHKLCLQQHFCNNLFQCAIAQLQKETMLA